MTEQQGALPGVDVTTPSTARMYDYYLGGKDHFKADREAADEAIEHFPEVPALARGNRGFLQRAVRHLVADCGIRQLIDIGTGIPTAGNVHEVAHAIDPQTRVAYVDNDPTVLAHARALLANHGTSVTVIDADIRDPDRLLAQRDLRDLIDFDKPVAVTMVAILHFVTNSDGPSDITARFRDAVVPGSYLAISHVGYGTADANKVDDAASRVYGRATSNITARSDIEIRGLFAGFELIEPGLVDVSRWRPDEATTPTALQVMAGAGRKP